MRCVGQVAHVGRAKVHTECWWEDVTERDSMEDLGTNWRILQCMFKKQNDEGTGSIDITDLAQNRDKWQSVVKMVMNHWVL